MAEPNAPDVQETTLKDELGGERSINQIITQEDIDAYHDDGLVLKPPPVNMSSENVEEFMGPYKGRVQVGRMQQDGSVKTETFGAAGTEAKEGAEPDEAEQGEEQKQAAAEEVPKGEGGEAPAEVKADAEEKPAEPERKSRRQRKAERFAAMTAENAALKAQVEAMRSAGLRPQEIDFAGMPKVGEAESDEAYTEAVQKWVKEQWAGRGLAEQQTREQAAAKAEQDAGAARQQSLDQAWQASVRERYTPEQHAELAPKLQAIRGKFAAGDNPKPVSSYFLRQRAALEAAGSLDDGAKSSTEVFGDLYGRPDDLRALEDLTSSAPIIDGLAALDDPMPVVLQLKEQGVESLEALARANPHLVHGRLAVMAAANGGSKQGGEPLPGSAKADGEPAEPASKASQAPPPGHSPRGSAGPGSAAAKPSQAKGVDPAFLNHFAKSAWTSSTGDGGTRMRGR